jgi:hypothetical protein
MEIYNFDHNRATRVLEAKLVTTVGHISTKKSWKYLIFHFTRIGLLHLNKQQPGHFQGLTSVSRVARRATGFKGKWAGS